MTRLRRRWSLFLGGLLGFPCVVTGERVWPNDRDTHRATQHPTDGPCS